MSQSTAPAGQIVADLGAPVFAELLDKALATAPALQCLCLIDIGSGRCLQRGAAEDEAQLLARARDVMGSGDGSARRQWLGGRAADTAAALRLDGQWLVLLPPSDRGLAVIAVASSRKHDRMRKLIPQLHKRLANESLETVLSSSTAVNRGWLLNLDVGTVVESYRRGGTERSRVLAAVDALGEDQLLAAAAALSGPGSGAPVDLRWPQALLLEVEGSYQQWERLPFVPELLVMGSVAPADHSPAIADTLITVTNDVLRELIAELLAGGLNTEMEPFPKTDIEFVEIVEELRNLDGSDLAGRLIKGGFADHPVGSGHDTMRCQECIYYLPHARWCDLPELPVPVEPNWFCRLWKL